MQRSSLLRTAWLLPLLCWTLLVAGSLAWNALLLTRHVSALATNQGRDIFRMVEAMRLWNARHGGLYAFVSERAQPNPYLFDLEKRDLTTTKGQALTLINPAYMTRQLSETFSERTGINIHITSLRPINPDNQPESWEAEALRSFESGKKEYSQVFEGAVRQVRYMAPLVTQEACLQCHGIMGYRVGDIRGGISVSFSAEPIRESLAPYWRNIILGHGLVWLFFSGLGLWTLDRWQRYTDSLRIARDTQEALVATRTAALRKEATERRQAERQLRHLVNAAGNGIVGVDDTGHCSFCNPAAQSLLGISNDDQIIGRPIAPLLLQLHPVLAEQLPLSLQGEVIEIENLMLTNLQGKSFPITARIDPIMADSQPAGAVINFSDITERHNRQQAIWRQANFDTLTGLPNRNLFADRFERARMALHRQPQADACATSIALLFIDLDGFKEVNDRYGHAAGDLVLIAVANRIQSSIRETDLAARLAGDEFLVALTEINTSSTDPAGEAPPAIRLLVQKLLDAIAMPIPINNENDSDSENDSGSSSATVSASIGVACYPHDASDFEDLLDLADRAMYQAKSAGKSCFCVYARE